MRFTWACVLLLGCSGPSNVEEPSGTGTGTGTGTGGATDLFPLAVGASWTFELSDGATPLGQKIQSVVSVDADNLFRLETIKASGNLTVSFQKKQGDDVIRLSELVHKDGAYDGMEVYEPFKLRVSNGMLDVGMMRAESYVERSYDRHDMLTKELAKEEEWVIGAIESVTVPAGTFDDAVRVHRTGLTTGTNKTYWFVSDVGKVKEVAANQTEELSSYEMP